MTLNMKKETWQLFLVLVALSVSYSKEVKATQKIWEDYPLVRDKRNFKESAGGKSIPAQGRVLRGEPKSLVIDKKCSQYEASENNWRYVIAMNFRRGDRDVFDILSKTIQMIPEEQRQRLAVVLGINEKVTVKESIDYAPTWCELLDNIKGKSESDKVETLSNFKIPVLLVYFQWTSFRESAHQSEKKLDAQGIRGKIASRINSINNQNERRRIINKLKEEDKNHQFPFGEAREFLLENTKAKEFILKLHEDNCSVYVHIQDADFISYQEQLLFGDFQGKKRLIPANQNSLLSKFDKVIAHHKKENGRLPLIVGGAHVYSPKEDLEEYMEGLGKKDLASIEAKYWTRFASEMGNNIKHIIGQQHPYGLYFHEPNTLVLSPASAKILTKEEKSSKWKTIYDRLIKNGFCFGISSEMENLTRTLFKDAEDEVCRQGMVFSSTTVLSTSMKRVQRPFTIKFKGEFVPETNMFSNVTKADLSAIRGMSQEVISINDWGSNVATSFRPHLICDARKFLYLALGLCDPIDLYTDNQKGFLTSLVHYNAKIEKKKQEFKNLFHNLCGHYNKLKKGSEVALQIITAGWESGQVMRLMLLSHLSPPANMLVSTTKQDQDIQIFLARRFNFELNIKNPFVIKLLNFTSIVKNPITTVEKKETQETKLTQIQIANVINYLSDNVGKNPKEISGTLDVDSRTIPGLKDGEKKGLSAWKKVSNQLESPEMVREVFEDLETKQINHILSLLQ